MLILAAVLSIIIIILSGSGIYYVMSRLSEVTERLDDIVEILGATPPTPTKTLTVTQIAAHWFILAGVGPDPHFHNHMGSPYVNLVYESLFSIDPVAALEGEIKIIPWLAKNYTVSSDGTVYTVNLRTNVKFHNTNNTMTAEDVKYSVDRLHRTEYPVDITGGALPMLFDFSYNRTEVVSDYQVKFYLKYANPAFIETTSGVWWPILEKAELEAHAVTGQGGLSDYGYKWLNNEFGDAGTGPYRIKDIKLGERYEVERCDNYWGGPPELELPEPKFDNVVFLGITEEGDARMKLERGDLDIIIDASPEAFEVYKGRPGFGIYTSPSDTWMNLWMHTVSGYLQDWRVRKAIKLAIDYDTLAEDVMRGSAWVAQGAFTKITPGSEKTAHYFTRNVEEARALLDDAGYTVGPDGWRFTIDLYTRPAPRFGMNFIDFATVLKDNLADIEINLQINVYEVGEWMKKLYTPTIEGMWTSVFGAVSVTEPWRIISDMILEPHCNDWLGYNETTQASWIPPINFTYMRGLYQDAMAELDPKERVKMWQELDAYVLEYGPGVNLVINGYRIIYSEKITGFYYSVRQLMPWIFFMDRKD